MHSAVKQIDIFSIFDGFFENFIFLIHSYCCRIDTKGKNLPITEFEPNLQFLLYSYCLRLHEEFNISFIFRQMPNLNIEPRILHEFCLMQHMPFQAVLVILYSPIYKHTLMVNNYTKNMFLNFYTNVLLSLDMICS